MTWAGQVRHLIVKDLTEHRWIVCLYLVAVLIATGHTIGWRPFQAPVLGSTMVFVGLVGAVLAASIVQGDSPTRGDAFWASHPIDASAMLAAKLCLALSVLALPIIAQVIALHAYDITWNEAVTRSIHDSRMFALIVLGALVVAALTRDLKSFLLTVIAIPVTILICVALASMRSSSWGFTVSPREAAVATILCAFVEIVLLIWLYHTRDARQLTRIIGFALVGLSFVGLVTASVPARSVDTPAGPEIARVPLRVEWAHRRGWQTMSPLAMTLVVGPAAEGFRYAIENPRAVVKALNGSTVTLWMSFAELNVSHGVTTSPLGVSGIRWLNADTGSTSGNREQMILLDPAPNDEQRRALQVGVESVVVTGDVRVTRLTAGPTLGLVSGARVVGNGRRIELENWGHVAADTAFTLRTRTVNGPARFDPGMYFGPDIRYALVNRKRGEGVVLLNQGNNFSADGMVIPGSTMIAERSHFALPIGPTGTPIVDEDWLRQARLQVIDGIPLGSYKVTLPPLVPPSTAQ